MPFVYDVYGTLLDVDAATRQLASEDGREEIVAIAGDISARWRQRQLSSSWLCSLMGQYTDFWTLTCAALDVTLAEMEIDDPDLREKLLALYLDLSAYDEVPAQLKAMKEAGHQLAVLSNGNSEMLNRALHSAGIAPLFDAVLSVDSLRRYKPDPLVYAMVTETFGCTPQDVRFFSSNNWDIAGAGAFGFRTLWVNRAARPWDVPPPRPWAEFRSLTAAHAGCEE